jgi:CheY-like chemotaxis protein
MTRVVVEALQRVASPDACESVLHLALVDGAMQSVPDDPVAFRRFALGPLKRAMIITLSQDLADAVLTDLGPIVERAASTITSGLRPRAGGDPILLVASSDRERIDALTALVSANTRVRVVSDVFQLLVGAEATGGPLALVIDCSVPSVRPAALVTLARVLPASAHVVLWGFDRFDDTDILPVVWAKLDGDVGAATVITYAFPADEDAHERKTAPNPQVPPVAEARPTRVAVVSEDATLRGTIVNALRPRGVEVYTAPDGFMAMELITERGCDIVIAEERMKRLDGARLATLLRRMMGSNAPAVVLVADKPSFVGGVAEVLVRGVDEHRLFDVVERLHAARR